MRHSPDVRVSVEELSDALQHEVLKRDAIEGDKFTEAAKLVARAANKALRQRRTRAEADDTGTVAVDDSPSTPTA